MSKSSLAVASKQPKRAPISLSTLQHLNIKMPKSPPFEEAIIGALMLDKNAYDDTKQFLKTPQVFSHPPYQTVFKAIENLVEKSKPVDLLTVNEQVKKMGMLGDPNQPPANLKSRKLAAFKKAAIGSYELTELTNRVASTGNIEAHSAILYQLYMRREAIERSLQIAKDAANMEKDIFQIYADVQRDFRAINPSKVIRLKTMNEAMAAGKAEPPSRWVGGNLFKENEVCILFADAGDGKSVFAFQVADAVSKGQPIFRHCDHPDFVNQCDKKLTYFYDFELEESELFSRYSYNGEGYNFSDKFVRGQLDPNFLDFENADELIANEIQRDIEINQPEFVVIDNLTYIISESQDSAIATKLMKRLLAIQKRSKQPLTIVVIAHTPKRDPSMPILMKNLAGSMNLANFAKSIVAISKSSQDPNKRYIKHIKCRNGEMFHGSDNVIECIIVKSGARLEYEFLGFSKENDHLATFVSKENEEEAIEKAYTMRANGTSYRDIAKSLKKLELVYWSHTTVKRKIAKYTGERTDPIFDEIDKKADEAAAAQLKEKAEQDAKVKSERQKLVEGEMTETMPEKPVK